MPTTALAVSSPASNAMNERELSCEKHRSLKNSKQACGTRRDEEEILAGFAFALEVCNDKSCVFDVGVHDKAATFGTNKKTYSSSMHSSHIQWS